MSETTTEAVEPIADESAAPDVSDATTEVIDGEDALGDAGKKALDAMKSARNEERTKRRAIEKELADLRAAQAKPAADAAPDADAIRAEIEAEIRTASNERVLRSEIKAAATGKLADPADAALYLNLSDFEVGADGNVDESEIADAIDDLISKKPHLAAAQGGSKGTGDGGARKGHGPTQLTRNDLAGMSSQAIAQAESEGRLTQLLGSKS